MKKLIVFIYQFTMVEFINPAKEGYRIMRTRRRIRRAARKAEYLSEMNDGKKFLVLESYDGSYQPICKDDFKLFRLPRRGRFDRNVTWQQLCDAAVYTAPKKKT